MGNVHLKTEKNTEINFTALRKIEQVTTLPLVLHGGSGIPLNVRKYLSQESSVSKFNIGTELRREFGNSLRRIITDNKNIFDRIQLLSPTIESVKKITIEVITSLNGIRG